MSGKKRFIIFKLYFFIFTIVSSMNVSASEKSWVIGKDHSQLNFEIPYMKWGKVHGRFDSVSGEVGFTQPNSISELKINIKTDSITTGHKKRDGHLKSPDFFSSKKHPLIRFESKNVKLEGENYKAQGYLYFKKSKIEKSFTFKLTPAQHDTWNYLNRIAIFNFTLNRQELGLSWNKSLPNAGWLLGDQVRIYGTFQLQLSNAQTPATKHMIPDTKGIRERERLNRGELDAKDFDKKQNLIQSKLIPHNSNTKKVDLNAQEQKPFPIATDLPSSKPRSSIWWLAYLTMAFLGFLASCVCAYLIKRKFSQSLEGKYEEDNRYGFMSDLFAYSLLIIYAASAWKVGWGF